MTGADHDWVLEIVEPLETGQECEDGRWLFAYPLALEKLETALRILECDTIPFEIAFRAEILDDGTCQASFAYRDRRLRIACDGSEWIYLRWDDDIIQETIVVETRRDGVGILRTLWGKLLGWAPTWDLILYRSRTTQELAEDAIRQMVASNFS